MEELTVNQVIDHILINIADRVERNKAKFSQLGLRDGVTGLSLFNYALYLHYGLEHYRDKGDQYLEKAFKKLNKGYISPILYREIAELGWFVQHCSSLGLAVEEPNEVLNDIDDMLYEVMKSEMEARNFDPITGVLAYGHYFLSRVKSRPELANIIQEINDFLLALAQEEKDGIYWKSQLKQDDSSYLGISHGSANVILFMVYSSLLLDRHDLKEPIRKACNYIVNNQIDHPYLVFPVIVGEDLSTYKVFPKHYCYGDYGTLYGLYRGFDYLQDEKGKELAVSLIQKSHDIGYEKPMLVAGPSLLYGHAGLAMLFRRFHQYSGVEAFEQVYYGFVEHLVERFNECDNFLGYHGYWNQSEKITNYSFFEGMLGISMLLMSVENDKIGRLFEEFFFLKHI